jgi:Flp pilus assembly protein CpaB
MALSLAVGALTAVGLRAHLREVEARTVAAGPTTEVVSAARDLARGIALGPEDLATMEVPEAVLPPGAIDDPALVVGRTLTAPVAAGEVLTDLRLARAGPVAALVPAGLRAVPLTVRAPSGILAPGDRVDVVAATPGEPFAETVAGEVEVLSVGPAVASDVGEAVTLVVLVAPTTAERLAAARTVSDLSVAVAPPVEAAPQ